MFPVSDHWSRFSCKCFEKLLLLSKSGMLKVMSFKVDSLADTNHEEVDFNGISVLWSFLFDLVWVGWLVCF